MVAGNCNRGRKKCQSETDGFSSFPFSLLFYISFFFFLHLLLPNVVLHTNWETARLRPDVFEKSPVATRSQTGRCQPVVSVQCRLKCEMDDQRLRFFPAFLLCKHLFIHTHIRTYAHTPLTSPFPPPSLIILYFTVFGDCKTRQRTEAARDNLLSGNVRVAKDGGSGGSSSSTAV